MSSSRIFCPSHMNHTSQKSSCCNYKVFSCYFFTLFTYYWSYSIILIKFHIFYTKLFSKLTSFILDLNMELIEALLAYELCKGLYQLVNEDLELPILSMSSELYIGKLISPKVFLLSHQVHQFTWSNDLFRYLPLMAWI